MKDITDNKNIEDIVSSYRNINLPLRLVGLLGKSRMTLVEADEIDEFMVGWLRTTLHHQLQKARQDWLREEIVKLEGMKQPTIIQPEYGNDNPNYSRIADTMVMKAHIHNQALQTIIDRYHSELDQDTELLNSVKEDWDKQAKNAMNGLDQDVSK